MRAFFTAIVLLLFAAEASAFMPGPIIIRECPKCRVPIEQATMRSGNTFGARIWSDGKMGAPMLPDYPWLVKCPRCKHLFWIDEAKKLGDTRKGWKGQGKVVSQRFEIPTARDFYRVVAKAKGRDKQEYIRGHLWQCANDPYRDKVPVGNARLSVQARANMSALFRLLNEKDPQERLTKAEIARELGQFDGCLKLLNTQFDWRLRDAASAIRMLAQERYTPVVEFTKPNRYRIPPSVASAKPADAENRLFIRSMKESCVPVASGLLARYSVDALLRSDPQRLNAAIAVGAAKGDGSAVAVVLNTAVIQNSVEAVRFLLDSGASVNGRSDEMWTPLMTACLCGSESVASLLIDRSAQVNVAAQYDLTPLNLACRGRFPGLAKLLLDRGASVDQGSANSTPLMTLCTRDVWDGADNVSKVDFANKTLEMLKLLIDHGAKVNGVDPAVGGPEAEFRSTPLVEVCQTEFSEDKFAPIRYTKAEKAACQAIYLDIIRLLLDSRADINKGDYRGASPLAHACEAGNLGAVKLLLERRADVNKAAKDGTTPLSIANKLLDRAIAKLLLEHGARPKTSR